MTPDSPPAEYPYTGDDFPDRTGGMLVLEASRLAFEEPIQAIGDALGIDFDPDDPAPEYTLDISFDTDVEVALSPAELPIATDFKLIPLQVNDDGTKLVSLGDGSERPEPLVTGSVSITLHEADEGAETNYGKDRSPERVTDGDAVARAIGPTHEVRLSEPQWTLQDDAIESARPLVNTK